MITVMFSFIRVFDPKREPRFWPYLYFDECERALIWWAMPSVSQHFCPKTRDRNLLAEYWQITCRDPDTPEHLHLGTVFLR